MPTFRISSFGIRNSLMTCQTHLYRRLDGKLITRRWFFEQCGVGLGAIALGQLFRANGWAAQSPPSLSNPLAPKRPHFAPKAKRVIYLFMAGAPSHLELFDYKPELAKWNGKVPPAELVKGYRAAFINPNATLLGPKFKFQKHGQSGAESLSSCLTWPRFPTTSRSSNPCIRTRSTMRPGRF